MRKLMPAEQKALDEFVETFVTTKTLDTVTAYNLATLPETPLTPIEQPVWIDDGGVDRHVANKGRAFIWSGPLPPPTIGSAVTVAMNNLGPGTVDSYFIEHGFLGVKVKLANPPEWHIRQTKGTKFAGFALVFGAELKP